MLLGKNGRHRHNPSEEARLPGLPLASRLPAQHTPAWVMCPAARSYRPASSCCTRSSAPPPRSVLCRTKLSTVAAAAPRSAL